MGYDIVKARNSGVSDEDSIEFLAKQTRYDLQGARSAGVPQGEILNALLRKTNSVIPPDQPPAKIGAAGFGDAMREVAREQPVGGRLAAAATTARNLYEGGKQIIGKEDKQAIEAQKVLANEYPGAAIAGGVATYAPLAVVPGANTLAGAGVIGGVTGALQPASSTKERAVNTGVGTVLGLISQKLGDWAAKWIGDKLSAQTADLATQKAQNQVRDAVAQAVNKAGYKIPPSQAPNAGRLTKLAEGFAGKVQTAQKASAINQQNTNRLARAALDLPEEVPLSKDTLDAARRSVGKAYDAIKAEKTPIKLDAEFVKDIKGLANDWQQAAKEFPAIAGNRRVDTLISGMLGGKRLGNMPEEALSKAAGQLPAKSTTGIVEITRQLRREASANIANWQDPEKQALGYAQRKASDALERLVDRNLTAAGKPDLVKSWQAARQWFAKSYDVEAALNDASGNVSARVLARISSKGRLSDELAQIAKFAKNFPKAAQDVEKIGSQPGISPLDVATTIISPRKYGAFGVMFGRPIARSAILSDAAQNAVTRAPDYSPSLGMRVGAQANNPYLLRSLMGAGAAAAPLAQE